MRRFAQVRHRPPVVPARPGELVLVCDHLRSRANLSSLVRLAGCFGLAEVHVAGPTRVDPRIAREAAGRVAIARRRSLPPFLGKLKQAGYHVVGLEQATGSRSLFSFAFARRTALVVGNERRGL